MRRYFVLLLLIMIERTPSQHCRLHVCTLCVFIWLQLDIFTEEQFWKTARNEGDFIKHSNVYQGRLYFPAVPSQHLELSQLYLHTW